MGKLHNKKRNVGIIYEQIITFICSQTIEGNNKDAKIAAAILKEHFALNTQLNKEYKLFKALAETRGISESLGTSIINEAKKDERKSCPLIVFFSIRKPKACAV